MTMITSAALVAEGKELLVYIEDNAIPYVANGMSLTGMDCQGLVEYLLIKAGVPKRKCGLAGSNAHWRTCKWRGTPAECINEFGRIPEGAALFIVSSDGAEPAKYRGDGFGNASHMGLVWGKYVSIAASASRKKVTKSNFAGKAIDGGWNMIGLMPWVDYGTTEDETEGNNMSLTGKTCTVIDGGLNLRAAKSTASTRKIQIPEGATVYCSADDGTWAKIQYDADGETNIGYGKSEFLVEAEDQNGTAESTGTETGDESGITITLTAAQADVIKEIAAKL